MSAFIRTILYAATFAAVAAAQPASFFPLSSGNTWIYHQVGGAGSFSIQAGTPLATRDGKVYYSLKGYVSEPVFVRKHETGNLYWYNNEQSREELLTSFEHVHGGRFNAPFRPCEQDGEVLAERAPLTRFGDATGGALAIRYISHGCADAGVTEELYVENIGMVRRTVTTIAGPMTFELAYARLGDVQVIPDSSSSFTVDLSPAQDDPDSVVVTMTVSTRSSLPLHLRFPTSQDYDVVIRNRNGEVVYRWSEGRAFLEVVRDVTVSGMRQYTVRVPLKDAGGAALPDGTYALEAWITAGDAKREFSATVPLEIRKTRGTSRRGR